MVVSFSDVSGDSGQQYMRGSDFGTLLRKLFGPSLSMTLCLCIGLVVMFSGSAYAKTVYEKQPPITDKELVSFMEILPHFRAWAMSSGEEAHPKVTKDGKADFVYSSKAADWVKARGWDPVRFFCVMGRAAAALAIVEEGNDMVTKKPSDMPTVSEGELDLVRRHLASLLRAGNDAPPIKR